MCSMKKNNSSSDEKLLIAKSLVNLAADTLTRELFFNLTNNTKAGTIFRDDHRSFAKLMP